MFFRAAKGENQFIESVNFALFAFFFSFTAKSKRSFYGFRRESGEVQQGGAPMEWNVVVEVL